MEPQYISRFFFIYCTVTGVKKIVHYTADFLSLIEVRPIEVPLYYFKSLRKWPRDLRQFWLELQKNIRLPCFFVAYILNFKYSQTPLIRILRGHRKCPYERGVRIKCVELRNCKGFVSPGTKQTLRKNEVSVLKAGFVGELMLRGLWQRYFLGSWTAGRLENSNSRQIR